MIMHVKKKKVIIDRNNVDLNPVYTSTHAVYTITFFVLVPL